MKLPTFSIRQALRFYIIMVLLSLFLPRFNTIYFGIRSVLNNLQDNDVLRASDPEAMIAKFLVFILLFTSFVSTFLNKDKWVLGLLAAFSVIGLIVVANYDSTLSVFYYTGLMLPPIIFYLEAVENNRSNLLARDRILGGLALVLLLGSLSDSDWFPFFNSSGNSLVDSYAGIAIRLSLLIFILACFWNRNSYKSIILVTSLVPTTIIVVLTFVDILFREGLRNVPHILSRIHVDYLLGIVTNYIGLPLALVSFFLTPKSKQTLNIKEKPSNGLLDDDF